MVLAGLPAGDYTLGVWCKVNWHNRSCAQSSWAEKGAEMMNSRNVLQAMIGLAAVTLLLVGCGPQETAPAATFVAEAPAATPTPVPPTPTPVPPTDTPTPVPPTPGDWTASAEFGTIAFTVNITSTGITEITYEFSDWKCGSKPLHGAFTVFPAGVDLSSKSNRAMQEGWSIGGNEFTITHDKSLPPRFPLEEIIIHGTFDQTGTHASGTWEAVSSSGETCSSTWEASPFE